MPIIERRNFFMNQNTIQSSHNEEQDQEILDDILENLPIDTEIEVSLPSKGKFYNLPDPTAPVKIKPLTFDDERAVANIKASEKIDPIAFLLGRSVSNLNISELLAMDKVFLLYKIREVSYGNLYPIRVTCPKCDEESVAVTCCECSMIDLIINCEKQIQGVS